jgi:hypothetical protein
LENTHRPNKASTPTADTMFMGVIKKCGASRRPGPADQNREIDLTSCERADALRVMRKMPTDAQSQASGSRRERG